MYTGILIEIFIHFSTIILPFVYINFIYPRIVCKSHNFTHLAADDTQKRHDWISDYFKLYLIEKVSMENTTQF